MQLRQADADEAGPPGGVRLVQEESLLDQVVFGRVGPLGRAVLS